MLLLSVFDMLCLFFSIQRSCKYAEPVWVLIQDCHLNYTYVYSRSSAKVTNRKCQHYCPYYDCADILQHAAHLSIITRRQKL